MMKSEKQTFAFKLASKATDTKNEKWRAREGVSIAGCSNLKDPDNPEQRYTGTAPDNGIYC